MGVHPWNERSQARAFSPYHPETLKRRTVLMSDSYRSNQIKILSFMSGQADVLLFITQIFIKQCILVVCIEMFIFMLS